MTVIDTYAKRLSKIASKKSTVDLLSKTKFKSVTERDKTLIVLLDTSSSMLEHIDANQTKHAAAWEVLITKLVPNLDDWTIRILAFGGWDVS